MSRKQKRASIGIFDSGFGGLSILRAIKKELPEYDYIYLGDTARAPYGTRSMDVVLGFTEKAVDFLLKNNCELIILACNTASCEALRDIQQKYIPNHCPEKRVLGVVVPAVEQVVKVTKNNRVGVIATESTVASNVFEAEVAKFDPKIKIFQQACPLLVPIVEAGEVNSDITNTILKQYLKPLLDKKIDTLVLGCTHYLVLKKKIKEIIGSDIKIVSEADIVPTKLKEYLERHPEMETRLSRGGKVDFYSTDLTDRFQQLGSKFFGKDIKVKKAILD